MQSTSARSSSYSSTARASSENEVSHHVDTKKGKKLFLAIRESFGPASLTFSAIIGRIGLRIKVRQFSYIFWELKAHRSDEVISFVAKIFIGVWGFTTCR